VTWPRIALLTIGDGRDDLLADTLASLGDRLGASLPHVARARMAELDLGLPLAGGGAHVIQGAGPWPFAAYVHVDDRSHELGFGGAIAAGWRALTDSAWAFDYVLHVEEDWRFDRPVDLVGMAALLDCAPELAQVALRRNAVNPAELAAGGLVELWPDEYTDAWLDVVVAPAAVVSVTSAGDALVESTIRRLHWLEHGLFWTTNPSLYRYELMRHGWPAGARSEEAFTSALKARGHRFAFWGQRADGPWVTHTGDHRRQGAGY
jgi:hypothetical protein